MLKRKKSKKLVTRGSFNIKSTRKKKVILKVGDKVELSGNTAKAMNIKQGVIKNIIPKGGNITQRIFKVKPSNSKFTTPFLRSNLKKK